MRKRQETINIKSIDPDQVLSEDEKRAAKESFDAYDKLGYGTLEVEELQKVLEELGQKPSREEVFKMIQEVDYTNKGYLEYKDFLKAIAYHKLLENENEEDDTLEAFVSLGGRQDKQGDIDSNQLIKNNQR